MEYNKDQVCEILGVKKVTLRDIETNKKLEERLDRKGYKLLGKEKKGRNVYYNLELVNPEKEVYSNIVKHIFGSDEEEKVAEYFIDRTENTHIPLGLKDISEGCRLSTSTVAKLDKKMMEVKIIKRDDFFYFCIDRTEGEQPIIRECDKEEYKNFWKNTAYIKALGDLQIRYNKGEITLTELQSSTLNLGSLIAVTERKYYYRVKRFKTDQSNKLYQDIKSLVLNLYSTEDIIIETPLIEG